MGHPRIASFWNGAPLSFLEKLCLKSFADIGHPIRLYTYEPSLDVPVGVELADARNILPEETMAESRSPTGLAPFADRFRLNMMHQTGEVWVDCDVLAIKPLKELDYVFARAGRFYGNAILKLPQNSPALRDLLELVNAKEPVIPADWPWKRQFPEHVRELAAADGSITLGPGMRAHVPYMTFGPQALSYYLIKHDEHVHAQPTDHYYSIEPVPLRQNYFRPRRTRVQIADDAVMLHHVGGKPFRRKFEALGHTPIPHDYSLIGQACKKHGILADEILIAAE